MNPYDFARIDWSKPPERRKPIWHYQVAKPGTTLYAGSLEVDIYAETPIFIADPRNTASNTREAAQSMRNAQGNFIIPGSSLKGMLRSVVEALSNSCLTLFDGDYERHMVNYKSNVPRDFQHCQDNTHLCLACRTFGMLDRGNVFLGKINIGDACALAGRTYLYDPIYTAVLVEPKPRHEAFYLDKDGRRIAGRKFYFHHSPDGGPRTEREQRFMGGKPSNRFIQPLDYDTGFRFRLDFTNLEADEFGALLLALVLEDGMRHKIGYGKPLGLGSVQLMPMSLTLVDYAARYTQANGARGKAVLEGQSMWDVLYEQTDNFTRDHLSSPAMEDLRSIWRWPPEPGVSYYYPSKYDWFDTAASKGKRIRDTRNVPGA